MQINSLRQYWITAALEATGHVGDNPLFVLNYLLRFLRVAVLLALWRTILAGRGDVGGMSLDAVLTYTLIAEVFAEQLAAKTDLEWQLRDGSIATRFLQPMGLFAQYTAKAFGKWAFALALFSLPLLVVAPLLGVNPWPASASAAAWFVVSLALAISVGLAVEFIFGALVVAWQGGTYAVVRLRAAISVLLSGALVPLALMPGGLGDIFAWLPFASMASTPLRIYTGTGDPLPLVLAQVAWSLVLWPLAHGLWRANRERLVSYGG